MKLLIGLFSCLFLTPAAWALSPEAAITLLLRPSERIIYDESGYHYRIFEVEKNPGLQDLIDGIHERLLTTRIGYQICRDLLERSPSLIQKHLGMSRLAAESAADKCAQPRAGSDTSVVYSDPGRRPYRQSANGESRSRKYQIVVTNQPHLTLDSWTDAYDNRTTLFLHHSKAYSDVNLVYLTQTLAHELAIYFDAKSWVTGPGWERIPDLQQVSFLNSDPETVTTASLNPLISTVFAFIRAYKLERQMVRELSLSGMLGPDIVLYPASDYPFLRLDCAEMCLKEFAIDNQQWIQPLTKALIAFHPHYRQKKLGNIMRQWPINEDMLEAAIATLEDQPVEFLRNLKPDHILTLLIDPKLDGAKEKTKNKDQINDYVNRILLHQDLDTLYGATVSLNDGRKMDMLTFLSLPLLSDTNINLSSGPRPRIRSGGT